jgi:hypothetical protein
MQKLLSDHKSAFKWLMPFITGFAVVLLGFALYRVLHPSYPRMIVERANELQMSPREAQDLNNTFLKVLSGDTPTANQWQTIVSLIESDQVARKRMGLLMLTGLNRTKYRPDAVRYAAGLVNSSDSRVKSLSFTVLAKLHDSRWKEYALQYQNSSDPILRTAATGLLERQDRFK